ncbi:c-type cytochrome [Pseudomonas citronellolis]|uniref:c-type cytochrome n=1 Tax=Pseudomonas citronellolis TaxID=53408 RepID=UPI00209F8D45|nr:c-type cytochrome [Pseudomonas citronellolis]MCP1603587.1 cytochrome c553 [Pseudomonas citronellolis]MCP1653346.1 cytochrome c553 [Pseudomonas citronellolis]MCP1720334.1 cytochrome c553 [Pseudomonas citronellolis]
MKKIIALCVLVVIAGLGIAYGREGLDLYRLMSFMNTSSEARDADEGHWPRLTEVCVGCHGRQGHSLNQNYPNLAGQPAPYVVAQLKRFVSGERASATMAPLAMSFSDAEIKFLSEYFARQSAVKNVTFKPDAALQAKGEKLAKAGGCVACHGEGLMGHDQFPRLAGQGHDYLLRQLNDFAQGARKDPSGSMTAVVSTLSEDDRKALAEYLAALAPLKK